MRKGKYFLIESFVRVDNSRIIRAAERYADVSPEERARRRERGWGNEETVSAATSPKYCCVLTDAQRSRHTLNNQRPLTLAIL